MVDLRETIARLSKGFVAADIMTPAERLVCGKDAAEARQLLENNDQFDVIPVRQNGRITSFVERRAPDSVKPVTIQHVVGPDTPILDLIDCLIEEPFIFVAGRRRITGYIHFSDLNDPIVKIPLFVLLEGLERWLTDRIMGLLTEHILDEMIKDKERLQSLKNKMNRLKKRNADRDWVTLLYFKEILEAAVHFGKISMKQPNIDKLAAVRDDVFHAASKRELVERHADVGRLRKARDLCLSTMNSTPVDEYSQDARNS